MTWVGERLFPRFALLWVLALTLPGSPLGADYQQSYRDGIEALDRKRWDDMASHMREAIRQQPLPGGTTIKIYGMRFEPYLPYYYLGLALYRLNDCAGAVEAWAKSESYGEIKGGPQRDLQKKKEECQAQLPPPPTVKPAIERPPPPPPVVKPPPPPPVVTPPPPPNIDSVAFERAISEAEEELEKAQRAGRDLADLQLDASFSEVFENRDLVASLELANNRLESARRMLQSGRTQDNLGSVREAAQMATQAESELNDIRHRAVRDHEALRDAMLAELSRLVAEAREPLAEARRRSPTPQLKQAQAELEKWVQEAGAADTRTDFASLTSLRDRAGDSLSALRTAMKREPQPPVEPPPKTEDLPPREDAPASEPGAPKSLKTAAEAFLEGDFQGVLTTLGSERFSEPKARATAHLLSAAAHYTLYLESGQQETELERRAAEDIAACHGLDPGLEPPSKWFSPLFIQFFRQKHTVE